VNGIKTAGDDRGSHQQQQQQHHCVYVTTFIHQLPNLENSTISPLNSAFLRMFPAKHQWTRTSTTELNCVQPFMPHPPQTPHPAHASEKRGIVPRALAFVAFVD
jgi:hypothetical protein